MREIVGLYLWQERGRKSVLERVSPIRHLNCMSFKRVMCCRTNSTLKYKLGCLYWFRYIWKEETHTTCIWYQIGVYFKLIRAVNHATLPLLINGVAQQTRVNKTNNNNTLLETFYFYWLFIFEETKIQQIIH